MSSETPETEAPDALPEDMSWSVKEQLGQLRAITRRTGAIHDAQMLQLKCWPRLLFPCDQHAIDYDGEQRTLSIVMRMTEDPLALVAEPSLKTRIKVLEQWCWALLGPEWSISLRYRLGKKGGRSKLLRKGRRKVALPEKATPASEYGMAATTEYRRYRPPDAEKAKVVLNQDLGPIVPPKETP